MMAIKVLQIPLRFKLSLASVVVFL
jgi:hypothetical protein